MNYVVSLTDCFWIPGVWPWLCCTGGHRKCFFVDYFCINEGLVWLLVCTLVEKCQVRLSWLQTPGHSSLQLPFSLMTNNHAVCFSLSHRSSYECSRFVHNERVWPFALEDAATVCFRPVSGFLLCCWGNLFLKLYYGEQILIVFRSYFCS